MKKYAYDSSKTNELIIILHGACKTSKNMSYIENSISRLGYRTCNINYNWRYQECQKITEEVLVKVKYLARNYEKVHFIGHSLGGLIIRSVLMKDKPENLGKVIQIATPNKGSNMANKLKNRWLYKKIYGKVSKDLVPSSNFLRILGSTIDYELGIIAGDSSNLLTKYLLNFKENDGRVTVDETILEGARDHIIINSSHNKITKSACALHQIKMFMRHGKFEQK